MRNAQENKPRELWIGSKLPMKNKSGGEMYIAATKINSPTEEDIHFIEHSAYLALQAENEKLKQANKKLREGLEQYLNDENWMNGPIRKDGSRLVHNIPTMKRIAEHYIIQADQL